MIFEFILILKRVGEKMKKPIGAIFTVQPVLSFSSLKAGSGSPRCFICILVLGKLLKS